MKNIVHKRVSANKTLCGADGYMIYLSNQVTCEDCKKKIQKNYSIHDYLNDIIDYPEAKKE